jgi:phosphopantothenate-cysteine ligase
MTESSPEQAMVSFLSDLPVNQRKDLELELKAFGVRHASHHRPIALVTSGGTAADLELNSVRCLDNFSTGLRGSISVEEFLKRGYAVVHLWRVGSASPYGRLLSQSIGGQANHGISFAGLGKLLAGDKEEEDEDQLVQSVLDAQHDPWLTDPSPQTSSDSSSTTKKSRKGANEITLHRRIVNSSRLQSALKDRKSVLQEGRLLTVPFRSVEEYLAKLQLCAESMRDSQALAILYLAAAVSDFYVPKDQRSEHKIQSADGSLTLQLSPVPKAMGLLRSTWAPDAFVCSFKLETDKEILRTKAERAVQKYGCHMVIGNLLHTRHDQVWVLAPSQIDAPPADVKEWPMVEISKPRSSDESDALESQIMEFVVQAHFEYISSSYNGSFDKSGTEAVIRAHKELERKKREVNREIFWKQVQKTSLEWAGVAIGAVLSYAVSSALRRRMNG